MKWLVLRNLKEIQISFIFNDPKCLCNSLFAFDFIDVLFIMTYMFDKNLFWKTLNALGVLLVGVKILYNVNSRHHDDVRGANRSVWDKSFLGSLGYVSRCESSPNNWLRAESPNTLVVCVLLNSLHHFHAYSWLALIPGVAQRVHIRLS